MLFDPARLRAVDELRGLTAEQRAPLDRLMDLTAEALGVSQVAINLVDASKQTSVASTLARDSHLAEHCDLSTSLCARVVASDLPLEVSDVRELQMPEAQEIVELGVESYVGVPLRLGGGELVGAVCAFRPNVEAWQGSAVPLLEDVAAIAAELLERQVVTGMLRLDSITNLPRASVFMTQLGDLLVAAQSGGRAVDVVALDLIGFRHVNDAFDHATGNRALAETGSRIGAALAESGRSGIACRLAGDTFLVAATAAEDEGVLAHDVGFAVSGRAYELGSARFTLGSTTGHIRSSGGVSASQLVQQAVARLRSTRQGERAGRAGAERRASARRHLEVRGLLPGVEERGELWLAYQPIVDLATRETVALEALLRWTSPALGNVGPDEFIPLAESIGTIGAIGDWVLERAAEEFRSVPPVLRRAGLAINVAPEQLEDHRWPERVIETARRAGLDPSTIVLELTERTLASDKPAVARALAQLGEAGVRIALDDFGAGFASFGQLVELPIDEVKLDRQFVIDLSRGKNQRMVSGLLALGRELGLEVIAEGIENAQQEQYLRELGCRFGQGFHFARPAPLGALSLQDGIAS